VKTGTDGTLCPWGTRSEAALVHAIPGHLRTICVDVLPLIPAPHLTPDHPLFQGCAPPPSAHRRAGIVEYALPIKAVAAGGISAPEV
jgi:hypothetical protein